jgi:sugar diacid utilization regulator
MFYKQLMQIPELKELKLLGGKNGLYRHIRWLYFADCIECLDDAADLKNWIHGGELVIVTHESITKDEKKLKNLMYAANKKNVAGFIIHVGRVTDAIIQFANEIAMPVFELPLSIKIVDLSQVLCKLLIMEENKLTAKAQLFFNILTDDTVSALKYTNELEKNHINFSSSYRLIIFSPNHKIKSSTYPKEVIKNLQKFIQYSWNEKQEDLLSIPLGNKLIVGIFSNISDIELRKFVTKVYDNFFSLYNREFYISIGREGKGIEHIQNMLQESLNILKICFLKQKQILSYMEIGIYKIFLDVKHKDVLKEYYTDTLGPLLLFDKINKRDLCDTLSTYLNHNCHLVDTANSLFIHRNTLRYRLDRVESILGGSLSDIQFCMKLETAFSAKSYYEICQE